MVTEVNRMVAEGRDPSDIVTVWVGRVDLDGPDDHLVERRTPACDAATRDRAAMSCASRRADLFLGAVAEVTYTEESRSFLPGDTVRSLHGWSDGSAQRE